MRTVVVAAGVVPCVLMALSPAMATILTFEPPTGTSGTPISQSYGDRVLSTSQAGFTYGEDGEGFSPNVVADYQPAFLWPVDYGDLADIVFVRQNTGLFSMTLTADPGFRVLLYDFDMAGFPETDFTIDSVQVLDENDTPFFNQTNAFIAGAGPSHTDFDFAIPLVSQALTISFDSRNLGAQADDIGIDNIRFGQCAIGECPTGAPVPEPSTLFLFGIGLVGVARIGRRTSGSVKRQRARVTA